MNSAVDLLNSILTKSMDFLCGLMGFMPQGMQLAVLSIAAGLLLLLLYGRLSNQKKLRQVKDRIYGSFLEAVLFRHDGALALKAQARMLWLALCYFAQAVPPILVLMIPCILLLAQLNMRYAHRPTPVGKEIILNATVKDAALLQDVSLKAGSDLELAAPRLRIVKEKKAIWRLLPREEGRKNIALSISDGNSLQEELSVGGRPSSIVAGRFSNLWLAILYPGRKIIPADSPFEEIWLSYPERTYIFLGIEWNWLVVFLLLSIVAGLFGSKFFDVEI